MTQSLCTPAAPARHRNNVLAVSFASAINAGQCAQRVAQGFLEYDASVRAQARLAPERFQLRDWQGAQLDAEESNLWHHSIVAATLADIETQFGTLAQQPHFWLEVKRHYTGLIDGLPDTTCCKLFFNTITARQFHNVTTDAPIRIELETDHTEPAPALRRVELNGSTRQRLTQLLDALPLDTEWRNSEASAEYVLKKLHLHMASQQLAGEPETIEMLDVAFYRFTRAYVIGQLSSSASWRRLPIALALRNTEDGMVIDRVMLTAAELTDLLNRERTCFHVEPERVSDALNYLQRLMPQSNADELSRLLGCSD